MNVESSFNLGTFRVHLPKCQQLQRERAVNMESSFNLGTFRVHLSKCQQLQRERAVNVEYSFNLGTFRVHLSKCQQLQRERAVNVESSFNLTTCSGAFVEIPTTGTGKSNHNLGTCSGACVEVPNTKGSAIGGFKKKLCLGFLQTKSEIQMRLSNRCNGKTPDQNECNHSYRLTAVNRTKREILFCTQQRVQNRVTQGRWQIPMNLIPLSFSPSESFGFSEA